ncbi:hypothetical protein KL932_003202 [Ogataea haglerorum]|nr:hypothetical protein KL932_003202 [Ogataea haglerorum]KAG7787345.1 hypothetical protein KL945_003004 [Ogataea haglerorum]KAG7789716.1 hypothetical protein KL910_002422 [Ogataea haglerorum]
MTTDATKQHSCNECHRRKLRCSRDLPTCVSCAKFKRHCLYNRHSQSPLTRRHLTQVEEELRVATELLRALSPDLDIHSILANVKNGFSVWEIPELGRLRQNRQDPIASDRNFQVPQLLPLAVNEDYKITSENQKPVYSWDERDHKAIDGMAITDRSGYLGSHSSVAVISLVFGGYSWGGTPRSPVRRDRASVSGAKIEQYLNRYFETYHVSYPIVYRPMFWAQYNQIVPRPEIGWDSLMYTMAAIGAFMGSSNPDNEDDLVLIDKAKSHLNFELLETGSISLRHRADGGVGVPAGRGPGADNLHERAAAKPVPSAHQLHLRAHHLRPVPVRERAARVGHPVHRALEEPGSRLLPAGQRGLAAVHARTPRSALETEKPADHHVQNKPAEKGVPPPRRRAPVPRGRGGRRKVSAQVLGDHPEHGSVLAAQGDHHQDGGMVHGFLPGSRLPHASGVSAERPAGSPGRALETGHSDGRAGPPAAAAHMSDSHQGSGAQQVSGGRVRCLCRRGSRLARQRRHRRKPDIAAHTPALGAVAAGVRHRAAVSVACLRNI